MRVRAWGLTIPSLRIDEAFYDLPEMISAIRKAGLTFAPETASESIRDSIGKDIDMKVLCKSASLAYKHGWRRLKLYFMVGFPSKEEGEADKIINLSRELSRLKKETGGGAAEVKVSVNPFVPKAHTPFQWLGMRGMEDLDGIKKELLSRSTKKIKVEFHNTKQSVLEACLARGGRKLSDIIYAAWKSGAKMDSWTDFFDFGIWEKSFRDNGIDVFEYAGMSYPVGCELPWGHIRTDVSKKISKRRI